ncbi:MAG: hypothetical protein FJY55_12005, partial [Betaproteobacteria bacterium]|nr:hypothetical protein [Betaproteobacteria bacterium]
MRYLPFVLRQLVSASLVSVLLLSTASAQTFPSKPVNVVLPFPTGTSIDFAFRAIAAEASKRLGQPVVIDNRPGARYRLGVNAISRAPADGYLLSAVLGDLVAAQPLAEPDFKLALGKDYAPVASLTELPLVLAISS